MTGRLRRRAGTPDLPDDEGPFVSFTDLFIGILFLFLILVAALMLMHQEAVQKEKVETQQIQQPPPKPPKPELPAFRLGIVFNIYQRSAAPAPAGATPTAAPTTAASAPSAATPTAAPTAAASTAPRKAS